MSWLDAACDNPWVEPDVLEAAIKADYREKLRRIGAYVYSVHANRYGRANVDDLVCYKGKFYAVEGKRPKGKPTERQSAVLREVAAAGGGAFTATCWKDVWKGLGLDKDPLG